MVVVNNMMEVWSNSGNFPAAIKTLWIIAAGLGPAPLTSLRVKAAGSNENWFYLHNRF